jgi:hypothetical protein
VSPAGRRMATSSPLSSSVRWAHLGDQCRGWKPLHENVSWRQLDMAHRDRQTVPADTARLAEMLSNYRVNGKPSGRRGYLTRPIDV